MKFYWLAAENAKTAAEPKAAGTEPTAATETTAAANSKDKQQQQTDCM